MVVAVAVVHASHVRCTQQRVLVVAMRPRCLSSHEVISQYIVAIATRPRDPADLVIVDRAGNTHE